MCKYTAFPYLSITGSTIPRNFLKQCPYKTSKLYNYSSCYIKSQHSYTHIHLYTVLTCNSSLSNSTLKFRIIILAFQMVRLHIF